MNIYKFVGLDLELENKKPNKFLKVVLVMAQDKTEAMRILKESLTYPHNELPTFSVLDEKVLDEKKESVGIIDKYYINKTNQ